MGRPRKDHWGGGRDATDMHTCVHGVARKGAPHQQAAATCWCALPAAVRGWLPGQESSSMHAFWREGEGLCGLPFNTQYHTIHSIRSSVLWCGCGFGRVSAEHIGEGSRAEGRGGLLECPSKEQQGCAEQVEQGDAVRWKRRDGRAQNGTRDMARQALASTEQKHEQALETGRADGTRLGQARGFCGTLHAVIRWGALRQGCGRRRAREQVVTDWSCFCRQMWWGQRGHWFTACLGQAGGAGLGAGGGSGGH